MITNRGNLKNKGDYKMKANTILTITNNDRDMINVHFDNKMDLGKVLTVSEQFGQVYAIEKDKRFDGDKLTDSEKQILASHSLGILGASMSSDLEKILLEASENNTLPEWFNTTVDECRDLTFNCPEDDNGVEPLISYDVVSELCDLSNIITVDSLNNIALLTEKRNRCVSDIRKTHPTFHMEDNKVTLGYLHILFRHNHFGEGNTIRLADNKFIVPTIQSTEDDHNENNQK